jgi:hypothetical protein
MLNKGLDYKKIFFVKYLKIFLPKIFIKKLFIKISFFIVILDRLFLFFFLKKNLFSSQTKL